MPFWRRPRGAPYKAHDTPVYISVYMLARTVVFREYAFPCAKSIPCKYVLFMCQLLLVTLKYFCGGMNKSGKELFVIVSRRVEFLRRYLLKSDRESSCVVLAGMVVVACTGYLVFRGHQTMFSRGYELKCTKR